MSSQPQPVAGPSRPPSSLSRPPSSASRRTLSRLSHRPPSRHSHWPPTRQTARVLPLCQTLVTNLTGYTEENESEIFSLLAEDVVKKIDAVKQAPSVDLQTGMTHLKRHARKALIKSQSVLAEAFEAARTKLEVEASRPSDLDAEIKPSKLADHLNLLVTLSNPPVDATLEYAHQFLEKIKNPPQPERPLSWEAILDDEPFEGQHWEGAYGLPSYFIKDGRDDGSSETSSPLLSPDSDLEDRDDLSDIFSTISTSASSGTPNSIGQAYSETRRGRISVQEHAAESLLLRGQVEELQKRQYWRKDWKTDANIYKTFDIGDPSTLNPGFSMARAQRHAMLSDPNNEKYINEHDAVRDVLIGLQGRENLMLLFRGENANATVVVSPSAPSLLHISSVAQQSILEYFAQLASTLEKLRYFSRSCYISVSENISMGHKNLKTVEAFAEAVDLAVRDFDRWCSEREECILSLHEGDNVVSLLDLERSIRGRYSETYSALLDVLLTLFREARLSLKDGCPMLFSYMRKSPASFASVLLDSLLDTMQSRYTLGDEVASETLFHVFVSTAEPIWRMLGKWLNEGTSSCAVYTSAGIDKDEDSDLDAEFFIESNGLPVVDRDFWADGYTVRSAILEGSVDSEVTGVTPKFLNASSGNILSAGKSMGLLRLVFHKEASELLPSSLQPWPTFKFFIIDCQKGEGFSKNRDDLCPVLNVDDLCLMLHDPINNICNDINRKFKEVLFTECGLQEHLASVEGLFLIRRGDVLSDFCDVLFTKMDSRQAWNDFHFLNSSFRDVVTLAKQSWIDMSLVRFSHKTSKRIENSSSVRNLEGLTVEYGAPFPLMYIFESRSAQVYSNIFIFLLQVRRAKAALDNILVRCSADSVRSVSEMKIFYATRNKLSWFVNTLLYYLIANVAHAQLNKFHAALSNASSLDEMIRLHHEHLNRLEQYYFINVKTSNLHRALISILDMCMIFSECFIAFAGDTTFDASRISNSKARRHRSRKLRRESRNVVSFSQPSSLLLEESDDSDSDVDDSVLLAQEEKSFNFTISFAEEDFFSRNDKILKDLDSLVRYFRKGVDLLSNGDSENAAIFEMLTFSLQDWDS